MTTDTDGDGKTLGERLNNPFDLRYYESIHWAGLAVPPADPHGYCRFRDGPTGSPAFWGLRAGFLDIYNKWALDGLRSVEAIVEKFAPPHDQTTGDTNPTAQYAKNVHQWSGLTDPLDLDAPGALQALGTAFIRQEDGSVPYDSSQLAAAAQVALAAGHRQTRKRGQQ